MSALPNNKNKVKLQQPNNLNNKGLNNASILNTKNLPKPVNTSMGDGSNQDIAQVSSSTLANGANNNQGISNDYIKGIARDFSKTSSVKEKLALAKWLNKFAAGGTPPSAAYKPGTTNPNPRTYAKAHNLTDHQIKNQENRDQVFFDQSGGFNDIDEQGKNYKVRDHRDVFGKNRYIAEERAKGDRRMQNAKTIADQNQSSRQRWEAREAKGLNNLSREDYDRLSNEKVTYYDANGNAKEYAKYYGGYTQNGGLLNEMKIPKSMMTKEQYDQYKAKQLANSKAQSNNIAAATGTTSTATGTGAGQNPSNPNSTNAATGQNASNSTPTNNKTKDGYDVPEEGDLTGKPLGVVLSSARQRLTKPQFEIWKAQEYPRIADEYTRRINDTLTKDPRYLRVLKPLVNNFPNAFGIDNGKFIIKNPNIIPILSSSHYNGLIQGIMNNTLGFKTPPANPAQPQQ